MVPSTVRETLRRFADAGLSWPLGPEVTDSALEASLLCGKSLIEYLKARIVRDAVLFFEFFHETGP
ncbi:hypothetical protein [Acidocella facilis]|uniref:hypothetical protein n=1 Tax=Acidocella facilis TaxID=525 RepID=UPI00047BA57B|nr:hypothetical protein [Acidocella facilis]